MGTSAQPCKWCRAHPVWNRWTDVCFFCAAGDLAVTWVLRLGRFIWVVTERPKPKLPVARTVRDK